MTKIILSGCLGHMGKVITEIVSKRQDCEIICGVDINKDENSLFPIYSNFSEINENADVLIDFSHPSVLDGILNYAGKTDNLSLVLCTTGYTPEAVEKIKESSEKIPIFYSRNMSLGINLLVELSKKARMILGDQFDVEIIEKHHNQKIDAPSGTALMIADGIAQVSDNDMEYMYDRHSQRIKRSNKEIGIHAVRGGTIVGEHEVIFAGQHEVISLSHSAQSKELFAVGAVNAGIFMACKGVGLYDMSNMIG